MLPTLSLALLLVALAPAAQEGLRTRKSKDAIIKSNTSKEIAEAVGQRIENFCGVFQGFYDELGLEKKSDNTLVARLFNTFEEYETQYRRQNPARDPPLAYWSPSLNAVVLFNDEADLTLRQTLFHEASHQYLSRYTSDAPKWLNEGLAEYFEGWRMTSEGKLVEKRVNLYDLKLLQDCLRANKSLAPRDLAAFDHEHFDEFKKRHPELHPYLHYVTAWGIVYFSLELSDDPADARRIVAYLKALNEKGPRAVFEMEDWDAFEERWKAAILALEPKPVDVADFILLASGHRQSGEWKEAAALYEKALELDAQAPGASYMVGLCWKRMGHYHTALKWFEKARVAEPGNPSVPFQMAYILLRLDQEDLEGGDAVKALALAEEASKIAGGESPSMLEMVARCQAGVGDGAAASKTIKRILKLVEEDDVKSYYATLEKELKGK